MNRGILRIIKCLCVYWVLESKDNKYLGSFEVSIELVYSRREECYDVSRD